MNKPFPHQFIIPPHKIISNHLHLPHLTSLCNSPANALLTMRSKINPRKIRNLFKNLLRNLSGPHILLKTILRPNDLNPRILFPHLRPKPRHTTAKRSIGPVTRDNGNFPLSPGKFSHKPRSRPSTLHTILPHKTKPLRILHIGSKSHHRNMILFHKPVDLFFHLFGFKRNHRNTADFFLPHFFHGKKNILCTLMLNGMDQHRAAQIIDFRPGLLNTLHDFLHKRSLRTLKDHANLDIISTHGQGTAQLIRFIPHLLRDLPDPFCHFRPDTPSVIQCSVNGSSGNTSSLCNLSYGNTHVLAPLLCYTL